MSDDRQRRDDPLTDEPGARAATHGTPVPVQLAADRRARRGWAVFLVGPVIWFAHFMLVYLVAEAGCTGDGPGLRWFDPPVPIITTLVATVVAVALCGLAAGWAYRWWRASSRELRESPDDPQSMSGEFDDDRRQGSLAFAGLLLSVFSAVAVLFTGAPALVLGPC